MAPFFPQLFPREVYMAHSAFASALAAVFMAASASGVLAQAAQPAATASPAAAPAARAKWMPPVKGLATIEVIRGTPQKVGNVMHTGLKIRNTSSGPIALLRADEYWYDKDRKLVSGDTRRHQKPLAPGEIVEITMMSPVKPNLLQSQVSFEHANGKVQAKGVKAFK